MEIENSNKTWSKWGDVRGLFSKYTEGVFKWTIKAVSRLFVASNDLV